MKKNESGFALLWMSFWLPVIMLGLCSLYYLNAWLMPQEKTLQICRGTLLQELPHFSQDLQSFLELNEEVLRLRAIRLETEEKLAAAVASENVPLAAAMQAELSALISQQQALKVEQSARLQALTTDLQSIHDLVGRKIQNFHGRWTRQSRENFDDQGMLLAGRAPPVAVRPVPGPDDGPPTYELLENFIAAQALHISWKHQLSSQMKGDSQWQLGNLSQTNGCSGSLKPTPGGFLPILTEDKFL